MLWAAALALTIERRFGPAAAWLAAAAELSAIGVIHAYDSRPRSRRPDRVVGRAAITLAYAAGALFLLMCAWYSCRKRRGGYGDFWLQSEGR